MAKDLLSPVPQEEIVSAGWRSPSTGTANNGEFAGLSEEQILEIFNRRNHYADTLLLAQLSSRIDQFNNQS